MEMPFLYIDFVSKVAQLLGLSSDAKLLIIHADDLGMCRSVNRATFIALQEGAVSSASAMVPCPAFPEVAQFGKEHPECDIGIHSTLISEHPGYKWGPVSAGHHGPEMVDKQGYFWPKNDLLKASANEISEEISAQITLAQQLGLSPTHLDSHCFAVARPEYIPAYVQTARRFGLPFLITEHWHAYCPPEDRSAAEDVIVDDVFQAGNMAPASLEDYYFSVLPEVKPGLSELIVHLAFDDPELRSIYEEREPYGAAWRQRDFEVMRSPKFRSAVREHDIQVIHWGMIRSAMQSERDSRSGSHS